MAETLAYDLDGDARLRAQTRVSVPKTAQRDGRDFGPLNAVEHGAAEVPRVHW
jgi:hypothetical protein